MKYRIVLYRTGESIRGFRAVLSMRGPVSYRQECFENALNALRCASRAQGYPLFKPMIGLLRGWEAVRDN